MSSETNVRIGTCGWSYPSGAGAWKGIFYPPGRRVDELAYYAERFATVEINSSFYRPIDPHFARRWVARTPPGFDFAVKLYQKFTHPAMFQEATRQEDAALAPADFDEARRGLDPLASAGKLAALLVQFPPSFKDTPEARAHLDRVLGGFRDYPLAVELRHKSWSDNIRGTLLLLREYDAAWTQIDEPKFRFSIAQNYLPNCGSLYYMRLHGRNARDWWRKDARDERYDYLYSMEALKPLAETIDAAKALVRKVYVYFNNHFSAKAVTNALMLKRLLRLPIRGEYTPELLARYPEIVPIVAPSLPVQGTLPVPR